MPEAIDVALAAEGLIEIAAEVEADFPGALSAAWLRLTLMLVDRREPVAGLIQRLCHGVRDRSKPAPLRKPTRREQAAAIIREMGTPAKPSPDLH